MGKRGGKKSRYGRGGRGGRGGQRGQRADYQEVVKENERFERFYNDLNLVEELEREEFWAALRRELPHSFRFTGSKGHALSVQQRLKDRYIPQITGIRFNDEPVEPPAPIPWYPDQLAWQMTTPKNVIRKFAPFASFQRYLVSETSVGNISRQEAVSMIPPLLMDIKPGMTVLDLCAAPGSKTAQIIELLHQGEEVRMVEVAQKHTMREKAGGRDSSSEGRIAEQEPFGEGDWSDDGRTTGLLIANDIDYKRSHMLVHQIKRLNSPNLIVTNHDATLFPSIRLPAGTTAEGRRSQAQYLKFDRILADVPCSGDGTCRKNPSIWKDWTPGNAVGLHAAQVRILVRALQMLKVNGRVVYSTCSLNPLENEAVVASAVARCGGLTKVGVVDCSASLPELKRKPGLHDWGVMDRQGRMWRSWQEVKNHQAEHGRDGLERFTEDMFPPARATDQDVEFPFAKCMRVYPHAQDTGGFFITVLEKLSEIKVKSEGEGKKREAQALHRGSVVAAAEEIEAKPVNGTNPVEKINALDALALPQDLDEADDPSAAARQNQANGPANSPQSLKRELEDDVDGPTATKRPKFGEEADEAIQAGERDRMVHWPPPPAAEPDIGRLEAHSPPELASLPPPVSSSLQQAKKSKQPYEEPFKYLDPNHAELQGIYDFYHLSPRFPRDRFMVRNATGNPVKGIYFTSGLVRHILVENESRGIKFVHSGVKMFVKQDVQREGVCRWRIQTDGLPLLETWVGEERVVRLWSKETLRKLLVEMFPKVTGNGWRDLGEIGERVRDIEMGCYLLRIDPGEGPDGFDERMVLPLWRSLHSLNLMLPKEERSAMLLRLYNDTSPLVDGSKDRHKRERNGNTTAKAPTHEDPDADTHDMAGFDVGPVPGVEGEEEQEGEGDELHEAVDTQLDDASGSVEGADQETILA